MNCPPMWMATRPPFTLLQWQELEHQALIFKYLKAGMAVPPELLAPIRKSFGLTPPKFVNQQALGYCSYYGKKIDPEPGRCRRTDGKKWRCSRDAHPDSKYCERHMIRRRYRSRKHVESQAHVESQVASQAASGVGSGDVAAGSRSDSGSFPTLPLHTNGSREGLNPGNYVTQLQIEPPPSETNKKEYRFGLKSEADETNFLQKGLGLGNVRYHGFDSSSNGTWSQLSQIPSNPVSESMNDSTMVNNFFQLRPMHNNELLNLTAASRSKQQEVFGGQLSTAGCLRQDSENRQSLFCDWHWKRDLSSAFMEYRPSKDSNCIPDVNISCSGSL